MSFFINKLCQIWRDLVEYVVLVYFISIPIEKLVEKNTRPVGEILEIFDQIQAFDKDFIDVGAYFVHIGPF